MIAGLLASAAPAIVFADKPIYGSWGYDATAMDSAVKPGDDFFAYVNGSWAKRTAIASDRTFVGIDSVLNDQIDKDVRDDRPGHGEEPGSIGPHRPAGR